MARRSDGEEEVALLVNVSSAAATSLFSPTMWVRRPSRDLRAFEDDVADADKHENNQKQNQYKNGGKGNAGGRDQKENEGPGVSAHPHRNATTPSKPLAPNGATTTAANKYNNNPTIANTAGGNEKDEVSYLEASFNVLQDQETIQADLAHIAAIEAAILRAHDAARELQAELCEVTNEVNAMRRQNGAVKRMFGALGVEKEDFVLGDASDGPSRKKRMVAIGNRLVKSLNEKQGEGGEGAAPPPPPTRGRGRPPLHAATVVGRDASHPAFTPPSSCPVESQIAAAALTLSKGDPSVALLSLLEKALSARAPPMAHQMERDPTHDPPQPMAVDTR